MAVLIYRTSKTARARAAAAAAAAAGQPKMAVAPPASAAAPTVGAPAAAAPVVAPTAAGGEKHGCTHITRHALITLIAKECAVQTICVCALIAVYV